MSYRGQEIVMEDLDMSGAILLYKMHKVCNENFGKGNGVPILSCKIWHGQENNGMAASWTISDCGIAAIKGL